MNFINHILLYINFIIFKFYYKNLIIGILLYKFYYTIFIIY